MILRLVTAGLLLVAGAAGDAFARGNESIPSFARAKKIAQKLHEERPLTLYCQCRYSGKVIDLKSCGYQPRNDVKRASRLEWEHVVPAEAFGQSFKEWREGGPACIRGGRRFKGRRCAGVNAEFARMEADLYNLWPEVGELNGLRSNYSPAELGGTDGDFGGCKAKVRGRKFEPMPSAKGVVARTYLYMDQAYPGRGVISRKNRKLFEAWDKMHPVTEWECRRGEKIRQVQGNSNPVLDSRCQSRSPASETK